MIASRPLAGLMSGLMLLLGVSAPAQAHRADAPVAARVQKIAMAGRVTDAARLFDPVQNAALDRDLAGIEGRTRHQVVVATVPDLGGADVARFARDLGNRWGVGRADADDGVVILLAPKEQLVRIAVGEGLEDVLTDEVCQQIIDEVMLPEFREGRMFDGISKGVAALNAQL